MPTVPLEQTAANISDICGGVKTRQLTERIEQHDLRLRHCLGVTARLAVAQLAIAGLIVARQSVYQRMTYVCLARLL